MEKLKTKPLSSPVSVKAVRWKGWGLRRKGFDRGILNGSGYVRWFTSANPMYHFAPILLSIVWLRLSTIIIKRKWWWWNLAFKSAMCDSVGFIQTCHWMGDSDLGGGVCPVTTVHCYAYSHYLIRCIHCIYSVMLISSKQETTRR